MHSGVISVGVVVIASNMILEPSLILVVLSTMDARNRLAKVRALDVPRRVVPVTENAAAEAALELARIVGARNQNGTRVYA